MKTAVWAIAVVLLLGWGVVQQRKVGILRAENAELVAQVARLREEARGASDAAEPNAAEAQRILEERAELVRLRAEVSALRREKAAWEKSKGVAAAAAQVAVQAQEASPTVQAMQWVESVLNAPPAVKGTEAGNLRRKLLNREPLTEGEQSLLVNMMNKAAEVEKSPDEFGAFQSNFIGSLLGWNNDPRVEQVQSVVSAATKAAVERGYDYHAPGQNADKWDPNQKALNERATGAVQNLLTPEERAVFDRAFIGVLGVDLGLGVPK